MFMIMISFFTGALTASNRLHSYCAALKLITELNFWILYYLYDNKTTTTKKAALIKLTIKFP